jgi:hypothetical protein
VACPGSWAAVISGASIRFLDGAVSNFSIVDVGVPGTSDGVEEGRVGGDAAAVKPPEAHGTFSAGVVVTEADGIDTSSDATDGLDVVENCVALAVESVAIVFTGKGETLASSDTLGAMAAVGTTALDEVVFVTTDGAFPTESTTAVLVSETELDSAVAGQAPVAGLDAVAAA